MKTASGAQTDRAGLRQVLGRLGKGDVLMVTRLDRLARSTRDLLNTLAAVDGQEGGFRSLGDTWADTTTAHGRLMLTVLGGLAEFKGRSVADPCPDWGRPRTRQGAGRENGTEAETHPAPIREAVGRRDQGETVRDIARTYNVSHSTISEAGDQSPVTCNAVVRWAEALMPIRREYRWFL